MYPEKVGRLVIDGVADGPEYLRADWYSNLEDTDVIYESFLSFCHQAGAKKCPLYVPTIQAMRSRVTSIIDSLAESPLSVPFGKEAPGIITKHHLMKRMFLATYAPLRFFHAVAEELLAIETNNQTILPTLLADTAYRCDCADATTPWAVDNQAYAAIACSDAEPVTDTLEDTKAHLVRLATKSAFAAPLWAFTRMRCAGWRIRAKWRFAGPLAAARTAFPLLVVSPRFDPVTPLASARAVHARFGGSRLLVQNSHGHCSLGAPSVCTAKHIRAYFAEGMLPAEDTVCQVDRLPFIGRAKETTLYSSEDTELLAAMERLTEAVPSFGI